MDRQQINFRLDADLADKLDQKRAELQKELGKIPSRSEVVRLALEQYLSGAPKQAKPTKR